MPNSNQVNKNHAAVLFKNVSCIFESGRNMVRAVDDVSLEVHAGEFFSMLGPSGSGKTTCLRLIGGFENANSGEIIIFGKNAANLPPYARDVNTVFQDYALFPHMNVRDNVAYALMVRGKEIGARRKASEEMLERVGLSGFGGRKPGQLSGGQRQRVALARALINQPKLLLLDEPLGALDLKLREEMQTELKTLQRALGITFVYVTHDQGEALSMSDRVAVFNKGKIEQLDTPQKLYEHPRTAFVAKFVGNANVLNGKTLGLGSGTFALRPEKILVVAKTSEEKFFGRLLDIHYLGAQTRFEVETSGGRVVAVGQAQDNLEIGMDVGLQFEPSSLRELAE